MKKLFLFLGICFSGTIAQCYAVGSEGTMGTFKNVGLWRTSGTASNDQVVVSTIGRVVLAYPIVTTPGSANARMVYTDGTGSTITTIVITNTNEGNGNYVLITSTSGWGYKTYGDTPAGIMLPFDYFGAPPPAGLGQ